MGINTSRLIAICFIYCCIAATVLFSFKFSETKIEQTALKANKEFCFTVNSRSVGAGNLRPFAGPLYAIVNIFELDAPC